MKWFMANLSTIVVLLIVAVIVVLVIRKLIKDKKSGKGTCSCGCSNCPTSDTCHNRK